VADPTVVDDVFSDTTPDGVFGQDPPPTDDATPRLNSGNQDTGPRIPAELQELVGPGKKYATLDAALTSILPAQRHIGTLEAELKAVREKLKKFEEVPTSEDVLAAIDGVRTPTAHQPSTEDADSVAERVIEKLEARTASQVRADNIMKVNAALMKAAGSKVAANALVKAKAKELGLTPKDLQELAAKSPAAVLAHFNVPVKDETLSPPSSTNSSALPNLQNSQAVRPNSYKWYQAMKKEKGNTWYFSAEVTKDRMKHAAEQGKTFYE